MIQLASTKIERTPENVCYSLMCLRTHSTFTSLFINFVSKIERKITTENKRKSKKNIINSISTVDER